MKVYTLNDYYLSPEGNCQLGIEPWPDQCCCVCKSLLIDYWHCQRMPEELKQPGHCGCEQVRGYICVAGEIHEGRSGNSGWPHHSKGCEMFMQIKEEKMENQETFWVVWREGDRAPVVKHETFEKADHEAVRLARENPGVIFHVLRSAGSRYIDPDPIKRVWNQYQHLDKLLSDDKGQDSFTARRKCLFDCWAAIRESQEGKEKG